MKGWSFIAFDKRNRPVSQGVVVDQVGDGEYLCQFQAGARSNAQIVNATEMKTWQLFPDQEALTNYMRALAEEQAEQQKQAADAAGGEGDTGDPGAGGDGDDGASELERVPNAEGEAPQAQTPESDNESDIEKPDEETDDES